MGGSGGQGGGGLARPGQRGGAHWRVEVATPLLAMAPSGGGMAGALWERKRVQVKNGLRGRRLKGCVRQWCACWEKRTSRRR